MTYNLKFNTLYDDGLELIFVGDTCYNSLMFEHFLPLRPCQKVMVEDIENNSDEWFNDRRFIAAGSNIITKKFIVNRLSNKNPKYFSVIGDYNCIGNIVLGRGSFIMNHNNMVFDDIVINDHVTIATHTTISHGVTIGTYSHLSSYCQLLHAKLGEGSRLGSRSGFYGKIDRLITTSDYCNFMLSSIVTKSIYESGTYSGNKKVSSETSLTKNIF